MVSQRKWSMEDLEHAVAQSFSLRQVITILGLVPAGGNYNQVRQAIGDMSPATTHFTGQGWKKGRAFPNQHRKSLASVLCKNSGVQSFKLKKRLYAAGLKEPRCEECGWAQQAPDGRIPLELDHINGDSSDNRILNLRVLCPNCHSLKSTHRGRNKKKPGWRNR